VTLNDLERLNGRYIALFQRIWKTCVQLITASSSIELINQESTSITHEVSVRN